MQHSKVVSISYFAFVASFIVIGGFDIATPVIAVLFATFTLHLFNFHQKRWLAVLLFVASVLLIFYGFVFFIRETMNTLPAVIETSVPIAIEYAEEHGLELPFRDLESLRALAAKGVAKQLNQFAKFAEIATKEFLFLVIGLVIAVSIFLTPDPTRDDQKQTSTVNLYTVFRKELSLRFASLYRSFVTVMGAQLIISTINTSLTGVFVYLIGLPYVLILVVLTFLCGLLPIIGNLISNTVICAVALTQSPQLMMITLIYLVVVHKLEYFLNSKIIGDAIKNPMWLTLLALVVGERVMGIPGMIMAPVILHLIKTELARVPVVA